MKKFSNFIPTKLFFGRGSIEKLATETLPGKKAFVVISAGTSMRKFGYLNNVINLLKQNGTEAIVFDKILANPLKEHVMEGASLCREENCDFVIGLGGGSSIDSAKAIAMMAVNPGDYWDYITGGTGKAHPVEKGALPIVAITTTAGTGTETDPWTVISYGEEKIGFGIPILFPVLAIVDPEMMTSVPARLTAFQGFDAFFHAAEGYISKIATPISELYSLKSIELIYKNLHRVVKDGNDIEARENVALANTLSGMVESTSSCTSEHSLEHAMSARCHNLPHGAGLIIISLAYFELFIKDVPERYIKMAEAITGNSSNDPRDFLHALADMMKACGVNDLKMSDWGLKETDLPDLVKIARNTMSRGFTVDPRQISDDEVLSVYRKSFK